MIPSSVTQQRDDINPECTWIVSDTHFGHDNIRSYCHRPEDIEQTMMENWARAVPETDSTVVHLGDLSYRNNARFKNLIAPHLTGERKLLVRGNHDHQRYSFFKQSGFKLARPFWIQWGSYRIEFSHYPYSVEHDGSIYPPNRTLRLHGHIHNNGYYDGRRAGEHHYIPFLFRHINLSAEQTKYTPVNLQDLLDGYYGTWRTPA